MRQIPDLRRRHRRHVKPEQLLVEQGVDQPEAGADIAGGRVKLELPDHDIFHAHRAPVGAVEIGDVGRALQHAVARHGLEQARSAQVGFDDAGNIGLDTAGLGERNHGNGSCRLLPTRDRDLKLGPRSRADPKENEGDPQAAKRLSLFEHRHLFNVVVPV